MKHVSFNWLGKWQEGGLHAPGINFEPEYRPISQSAPVQPDSQKQDCEGKSKVPCPEQSRTHRVALPKCSERLQSLPQKPLKHLHCPPAMQMPLPEQLGDRQSTTKTFHTKNYMRNIA